MPLSDGDRASQPLIDTAPWPRQADSVRRIDERALLTRALDVVLVNPTDPAVKMELAGNQDQRAFAQRKEPLQIDFVAGRRDPGDTAQRGSASRGAVKGRALRGDLNLRPAALPGELCARRLLLSNAVHPAAAPVDVLRINLLDFAPRERLFKDGSRLVVPLPNLDRESGSPELRDNDQVVGWRVVHIARIPDSQHDLRQSRTV